MIISYRQMHHHQLHLIFQGKLNVETKSFLVGAMIINSEISVIIILLVITYVTANAALN